jgi:hypothetical protein
MVGTTLLTAVACDDSMGPQDDPRVTLSIVVPADVQSGTQTTSDVPQSSLFQSDGDHVLILDRVALVVREVELKRLQDDDCDLLTGEAHDRCQAFEAGPMLLELPLDGSVVQVLASDVPHDVYDEVEFDVHKPEDDTAADLQFLQEHPDFKGVSIRVEGSFDGESFVFLQDLNEEREIELVPPLVVEEGDGSVNLTLELNVASWFRSAGGGLLDPRSANKGAANEDQVEINIRRSIRAFPDRDRDGRGD